ncbi:MAG: hypothetical protein ACI4TG_06335, partial [Ruminococcus sp.]
VAIGYAYYKHNKELEEQEQQAEQEQHPLKPVSGFDYTAAKEQNDRQRHLLKQYEQVNRLQDDLIVAIKSGETMAFQISYYDRCGELQCVPIEAQPEWMQDFTRYALDDLTAKCSTYLSGKCE